MQNTKEEKYEEEQLDYEPSTDDQSGLLETSEQEDWTEKYGEKQIEYGGELDEETEAFSAELESILQGDLGIDMFILLETFRAAEGQESTLEGDVLSQESFECRLAEVGEAAEQQTPTAKAGRTAMKLVAEQLCFSVPTEEMAKMGRTDKDLILTRLTVTNVIGGTTKTHTPLLPLTMHCLAETGSTRVYVFLPLYTSSWPFVMKRARYYHDDLSPFTFFRVNQNDHPNGVTAEKLIEESLASSLEDWNRPCVLNLHSYDV
ncbi:unnamed protein product [Prunus armeniaca]